MVDSSTYTALAATHEEHCMSMPSGLCADVKLSRPNSACILVGNDEPCGVEVDIHSDESDVLAPACKDQADRL